MGGSQEVNTYKSDYKFSDHDSEIFCPEGEKIRTPRAAHNTVSKAWISVHTFTYVFQFDVYIF